LIKEKANRSDYIFDIFLFEMNGIIDKISVRVSALFFIDNREGVL